MARPKRAKVVFVLPNLGGGCAERVVLTTLRYLNHDLFDISLFLMTEEAGAYWDEIPTDVTVVVGSKAPGRLRHRAPELLGKLILHARRCDVIVGALELNA